jgi:flavin-dependent dehydrogenase
VRPPGEPWDVAVVGAGPAGAMTALECARAGASVLIVERRPFPRWKVCGACLSPGAQEVLRAAGLPGLARDAGGTPLRELRLSAWGRSATIRVGGLLALARADFDAALLDAARTAGARLMAPARAQLGALDSGARTLRVVDKEGAHEIRARVVVDASGLSGGFLTGSDARTDRTDPRSRVGVGAVFPAHANGYAPDAAHMVVGEGGYVGLVVLADGSLTVAAALDPDVLRRAGGPGSAVAAILETAGRPPLEVAPVLGWKGTPALTRSGPTCPAERVFTVGDAAGYVEPFTGEGIAWALGGARALAPFVLHAARSWNPAVGDAWYRERTRSMARAARLCRAVAWTSRRPRLILASLRVLAFAPRLASPFVVMAAAQPRWPAARA